VTVSLLDIAKEDGAKLAGNCIGVSRGVSDPEDAVEYFTRKRFRSLYRAGIMRQYGRNASNRECDLALKQAMEDKTDG
jgi:hypothetical protein